MLDRFPGAALDGVRYEPPFPFLAGPRVGRARPHGPARRLRVRRRRHRPRAHGDRLRRGRLPARRALRPGRSSTRCCPTAPTTSASASTPGRYVKDADPDLIADLQRRERVCCAPSSSSTPTRTAGARATRCSTTPSRPGTSRPRTLRDRLRGRQRGGHLAPGAHQARALRRLAGGQRRLGALARALLGHAAARLARRGRQRSRSSAPSPSSRSSPACKVTDPHRPYVDDITFPSPVSGKTAAARARGHRRVVRLRGDAVRAVARAVRERRPSSRSSTRRTSSARRSTRRAAGSTRCTRSRCCCATADVPQRRLPRPDPRRRGPEDVEVQGQHRRALGRPGALRRRRVPLVLLHLQAAVGRLPLLDGRRSARACGCFLRQLWNVYAFYARYAPFGEQTDGGETDLDRWIRSRRRRDGRGGHRAAGRLRRDVRGPRDRRARRRPLQLVRPALAPALLGRRRQRAAHAARLRW